MIVRFRKIAVRLQFTLTELTAIHGMLGLPVEPDRFFTSCQKATVTKAVT